MGKTETGQGNVCGGRRRLASFLTPKVKRFRPSPPPRAEEASPATSVSGSNAFHFIAHQFRTRRHGMNAGQRRG